MAGGADVPTPHFEPLRPAGRGWRVVLFVAGPGLWLAAVIVTVAVDRRTRAIEVGLLVTVAAIVIALVALLSLRAGRRREEERDAPTL